MRPAGALLGRPPGPESESIEYAPWVGPGLLAAFAVALGLLLYGVRDNPSVQWAIGLVGLGGLAAFAWRSVRRGTRDPVPLLEPGAPSAAEAGEIEALSQSVRRAVRGLPFSQVIVTSRARAAFLERMRIAFGISPEAMREAEADRDALRRLLRDDVLADFLHLPRGDFEERYEWIVRARGRGGFAREFRDVLDRMEAWR